MESDLRKLQGALQAQKIKKFGRRVPLGDLITERGENAAQYGFGEGTTMYDSVIVLGDVKVGRNCWIGPNVILDGTGGLVIGDWVCIDAGSQIYSHDSSRRFVTMGEEKDPKKPTHIGSGVFIGPNCVIGMGVTIGDRSMIGAFSMVTKDVPSGVKAWGQPAIVRGKVEIPAHT